MCTNLVTAYLDHAAEADSTNHGPPLTPGTGGATPPNTPYVTCFTHPLGQNRVMLVAGGPEQTRITYTLTERIAAYGGLTITSVTTNRADGAAGSFVVVGDIRGDASRLRRLARDFARTPWLDPHGTRVTPEKMVDLRIIAPDRCNLLRDALRVISVEHGINVETMVNRTYRDVWGGDAVEADATNDDLTGGGEETDVGDDTGLVSVTKMRLELPGGTNLEQVKRDLTRIGNGWDFTWTVKAAGPVQDRPITAGTHGRG